MKTKEILRKERGITLVALIITIIVLIILAAVTIMSFRDSNLIEIATNGTINYAEAQSYEQKAMDELATKLDGVIDKITQIGKPPEEKPIGATKAYAKLYEDGTLMISSTEYVDTSKGTYTDYGDISGGLVNDPPWKDQNVKKVVVYDTVAPTSTAYWFSRCKTIESMDLSNLRTDNVTDMSEMFNYCENLMNLDVSNFKTDNVTRMSGMFSSCSKLTSLDLSNFKTENVTAMNQMFYDCKNLTNLDLRNFKTDNVTAMQQMFDNCYCLMSLDVSNFKTGKVQNLIGMFGSCYQLKLLDLSGFALDNVTRMFNMFSSCTNLKTIYVKDNATKEKLTSEANVPSGCEIIIK